MDACRCRDTVWDSDMDAYWLDCTIDALAPVWPGVELVPAGCRELSFGGRSLNRQPASGSEVRMWSGCS